MSDAASATPPAPPDASVILIGYNSERFIEGCLESLSRTRGLRLEIIVLDNASRDRTHELAQRHPLVTKAIRSEVNLGFGGGNNAAAREATAPLLILCNPDCFVRFDTLEALVRPLREDPSIGLVGAKLLYPHSNRIQHAGGILHPNAMCEHHGFDREDGPEWSRSREVDYVTGALVAIRREDFESLGGFDEDYFPAYYEETDLCWRLRKRGKRIWLAADAVANHYESPGLVKNSRTFVRLSYRSRIRWVLKNYSLGEFLTKFLPFEAKWFFGPFAKGFRLATLRSYAEGIAFLGKCVARGSRRPRNAR